MDACIHAYIHNTHTYIHTARSHFLSEEIEQMRRAAPRLNARMCVLQDVPHPVHRRCVVCTDPVDDDAVLLLRHNYRFLGQISAV